MTTRFRHWRWSLALAIGLIAPALAGAQQPAQNPYRLKESDQTKLCVTCHTDFAEKLKKPFVHAAVKMGECSSCHDPHVSDHSKLLSRDMREICNDCHANVVPDKPKSTHKVVADGECQRCHDPHASDNPKLLVKKSDDLCLSCHKAVGDAAASAKFKHAAVAQGCTTCHDPHGSDKSVRLLKDAVPALCVKCHKTDSAAFVTQHQKYPVGKAACTVCHDAHGSNQPALLLNDVHPPVVKGSCTACHQNPDSATPFATKGTGFELCQGCHNDAVNAMLGARRQHGPIGDGKGCVNCHSPHASRQDKLLKAEVPQLCGSCHADTLKRIAATASKHVPVDTGMCMSCHSPHASDATYLINQASVLKLCAQCHDYAAHSAHPVGDKAIDPRNKNLRVDCLSCHKAHGTEFKRMLLTETNIDLCTRCHKKFK